MIPQIRFQILYPRCQRKITVLLFCFPDRCWKHDTVFYSLNLPDFEEIWRLVCQISWQDCCQFRWRSIFYTLKMMKIYASCTIYKNDMKLWKYCQCCCSIWHTVQTKQYYNGTQTSNNAAQRIISRKLSEKDDQNREHTWYWLFEIKWKELNFREYEPNNNRLRMLPPTK